MKPPQKILILEDDRTSSHLLAWFLLKSGYETLECGEGRVAIEMAIREKPDLLIADMMLPDMKGTDVLVTLKQNSHCQQLKFAILTSLLSKDGRANEVESKVNIDGVAVPAIAKPFNRKLLISIVERLVGKPDPRGPAKAETAPVNA